MYETQSDLFVYDKIMQQYAKTYKFSNLLATVNVNLEDLNYPRLANLSYTLPRIRPITFLENNNGKIRSDIN